MVVIVYTNVNLFNVTKLQHLTITKIINFMVCVFCYNFFKNCNNFIYLFIAMLGLHFCTDFSLVVEAGATL